MRRRNLTREAKLLADHVAGTMALSGRGIGLEAYNKIMRYLYRALRVRLNHDK